MRFLKTQQQGIGNSREARLYQGQALRVCAVRTALTEPSLPAPPEGGKGDGAAGAHPSPPAGLRFWGLFSKSYPHILRTRPTFYDCTFIDCLFIGTEFNSVEFHGCKFIECNFNKCKFISVYAKPDQFRKAITKSEFSNVAVHLYQQLRNNYYQGSQREFNQEAEYFFCIWNRKNNFIQSKRKNLKLYKYLPNHIWSWIYGVTLGYGYRVRNLIFTTITIILFLIIGNHIYADSLLIHPEKPSLLKTVYFTITTMATLGASGYEPKNDIGYFFVIINVMFGVTIFSASINSIFKKVIR